MGDVGGDVVGDPCDRGGDRASERVQEVVGDANHDLNARLGKRRHGRRVDFEELDLGYAVVLKEPDYDVRRERVGGFEAPVEAHQRGSRAAVENQQKQQMDAEEETHRLTSGRSLWFRGFLPAF